MNPWHAGGLWHRPRPRGSTFLDVAADVAAELRRLTAAVHCLNQGSDLFQLSFQVPVQRWLPCFMLGP
jgi:hypothetical protein